jgi:hypothetical protein
MNKTTGKLQSRAGFESMPRLSELADQALERLPSLADMERYYEIDDALDQAVKALGGTTRRNALKQALNEVGLTEYDFVRAGDEAIPLAEYMILRVRKSGRTTLERILTKRSTPGPDTLVGRILRAMLEATWHAGWIARVKRGVGVVLFDVIRAETLPMVCPELAGSGSEGRPVAVRGIHVDGFDMTTGAPLFMFPEVLEEVVEVLNRKNPDHPKVHQGIDPTPEHEAEIERLVLTSHYQYLLH